MSPLEESRAELEAWLNGRRARLPGGFLPALRARTAGLDAPAGAPPEGALSIPCEVADGGAEDHRVRAAFMARARAILRDRPAPACLAPVILGSYASGAVTPFSDVDLVFLVDEAALDDGGLSGTRDAAWRLLRLAHGADPLMHHGVMVLFRGEFRSYDQSVMPVAALENAAAVRAESLSLRFQWHPETSRTGALVKLKRQLASLRLMMRRRRHSPYQAKCLVSVLLLAPSLLLEAMEGVFPYKRDSFALARPLFSDAQWEAVALASRLREDWRVPAPLAALGRALKGPAFSFAGPDVRRKLMAAGSLALEFAFPAGFLASLAPFIERCEDRARGAGDGRA